MLEHGELWLPPADGPVARTIAAAAGGPALGSARWLGRPGPWWWPLARPLLEVREDDDEPLLFTVRRCWGLTCRYEVCDADGQRVGLLSGSSLRDCFGSRLAMRRIDGPGGEVFLDPKGRLLAEVQAEGKGLRLRFGEAVAGNPFAKMVLLAAVLVN
jgi:hypothetical protein